jgi:nucleotide-binding universal stress UspA family protein
MVIEPLRILIAVHGHEPDGWTEEVGPALAANPNALIRVLVVDEPPPAGFTSLLPAARRRYAGAVRMWRETAADARRRSLDELVPRLPHRPEVIHAPCVRGEAGRTIAEQAAAWPAHIIVVGRDARPGLSRGLLPRVHERVVRDAPCAIVVAPAAPSGTVSLRRGPHRLATGVPR